MITATSEARLPVERAKAAAQRALALVGDARRSFHRRDPAEAARRLERAQALYRRARDLYFAREAAYRCPDCGEPDRRCLCSVPF